MLLLRRRRDELIELSGGISIRICQIRGGTVLVGIEAPADVKIRRAEVEERDAEESA
jgi:carbon storage regulator CsrA